MKRLIASFSACSGGNAGIGLVTAIELAKQGATIIIACRDKLKAEAAVREIKEKGKSGVVEFVLLDLADLDSVRACVSELRERKIVINRLILNAGVMISTPSKTKQGFETQFGA